MITYERHWNGRKLEEILEIDNNKIKRVFSPLEDDFIRYKENGEEKSVRNEFRHRFLVNLLKGMNINELHIKYFKYIDKNKIIIMEKFNGYQNLEEVGGLEKDSISSYEDPSGSKERDVKKKSKPKDRKKEFEELKKSILGGKKIIEESKVRRGGIHIIEESNKKEKRDPNYERDLYGNGNE